VIRSALIICTRNRADTFLGLMKNLENVNFNFDKVIVVDSSDTSYDKQKNRNAAAKCRHNIQVLDSLPGLPRQRNLGISWLVENHKDFDAIFFLDDDARVESDYFQVAQSFIEEKKSWVAFTGYCTSLQRKDPGFLRKFFLLDSRINGAILTSGYTTTPNPTNEIERVSWLPGISMVFNPWIFQYERFNETLRLYYEDVEMSLRVERYGELFALRDMRYSHLFEDKGRESISKQIEFTLGTKWKMARENSNGKITKIGILWSIFGMSVATILKIMLLKEVIFNLRVLIGHIKFLSKIFLRRELLQRIT